MNALILVAAMAVGAAEPAPAGPAAASRPIRGLVVNGLHINTIWVGEATAAEMTAARELADYVEKITGSRLAIYDERTAGAAPLEPRACVYVGPSAAARSAGLDVSAWGPEQWAVRTIGTKLFLIGGRPRGTIYAVYRFLEDVAGVRWWNPFEEHVPRRDVLAVGPLDRTGRPRFAYRDIHLLYANDTGRFAARHRINGMGFGAIDPAYGCGVYYGPPNGVHTFYLYVPPETHFAAHPEWFSLLKGQRTHEQGQLCLTNPDLRAQIVRRLHEFIQQGRAQAERAGRPAPVDFDISQNDWYGACECDACRAVNQREGTPAGPLIEMLNFAADAIRDKHPEVRINTLAYQYTEDPPRTLRPRHAVVPRLCDTNANLLRPITHADNKPFADRVARWGALCKQLRIWDYAVTYTSYPGLPLPTVHTYAPDYRYLAAHNVEGIFTEHEHPLLADLRDLKIYMMMKLLEDPDRDADALLRDFTDGFFGAGGAKVREYLADLQRTAEQANARVDWFPKLSQYTYLTLEALRRWQGLFDEAARAAGEDAALQRRLRHARMPVDRACLVFWPALMREWTARGGAPEAMPLRRADIGARCRKAWAEQIELRFPPGQRPAQQKQADQELDPLLARAEHVPLPERFRSLAGKGVYDFTPDQFNHWKDQARRVSDPQAECGITARLELSETEMEKYKLPMPWGAYDVTGKKGLGGTRIEAKDIPGPGYHWYRLPQPVRLTSSCYAYFFWSWIIQVPLEAGFDAAAPDRTYELWARIRFEGPGFPHAQPGRKNAICIERVVLVRQ